MGKNFQPGYQYPGCKDPRSQLLGQPAFLYENIEILTKEIVVR